MVVAVNPLGLEPFIDDRCSELCGFEVINRMLSLCPLNPLITVSFGNWCESRGSDSIFVVVAVLDAAAGDIFSEEESAIDLLLTITGCSLLLLTSLSFDDGRSTGGCC